MASNSHPRTINHLMRNIFGDIVLNYISTESDPIEITKLNATSVETTIGKFSWRTIDSSKPIDVED